MAFYNSHTTNMMKKCRLTTKRIVLMKCLSAKALSEAISHSFSVDYRTDAPDFDSPIRSCDVYTWGSY